MKNSSSRTTMTDQELLSHATSFEINGVHIIKHGAGWLLRRIKGLTYFWCVKRNDWVCVPELHAKGIPLDDLVVTLPVAIGLAQKAP